MTIVDDDIIDIDISIVDLVEFDPAIGTESCHIFGVMGSGKSNFGFGVMLTALLDRDEFCIMPGDVACEWRHFPMHPTYDLSLTVIIPKDVKIFYYPEDDQIFKKMREEKREEKKVFVEADYSNLNVFYYLTEEKPLLVIYDQHLNISDRTMLWTHILETVNRRNVEVPRAINFLMHEAGIVFSEYARSKHWNHIKDFSEMFVETRKMGVRIFFISQLETELEYTLRRKCNFKIIKKSFLRSEYAKPVRAAAPFLKVNEYILSYSGMYRLDNTFKETIEHKTIWKMVPPLGSSKLEIENRSRSHGESMKGSSKSNGRTDKSPEMVKNWAHSYDSKKNTITELASISGYSKQYISECITKYKES